MKKFRKSICLLLCFCLLSALSGCGVHKSTVQALFDKTNKISYATTYKALSEKKNKTSAWREGMVSGNGLQGVITSGAPYSDSLIFQNMHFILPNENARTCPDTANELETVKQAIVKGEDIVDNASYDDVYTYHPGGALRIAQEKAFAKDYVRYTNYETAEVGVRYTDKNGTWERLTFTSRADGVTVTKIGASDGGSPVNLTLSFDNLSAFANYGEGNEVDLQYKKLVTDNADALALVAHYPDYQNSELRNGGYATYTYVICEGGTATRTDGDAVSYAQYVGEGNPQIQIENSDAVYLITVSDRTEAMGALTDFQAQNDYALTNDLRTKAKAVAEKYTADGHFDYAAALAAHTALHTPQFNAVSLTLGDGESDKSNEQLLLSQRQKDTIHSDLLQRAYYAGRYAYLCCSGASTSRLYGMWTGEWKAGWGSKYTMDANVNLQTSSLNTSNMPDSVTGYVYFLLRQMPDWEENALATHGFTDALQAPVNTDGDKAVITETCYPYPFRYWNAGTSWMLLPLYESYLSYGDLEIPLSEEFDLEALRSVLSVTAEDLTDAQIAALKQRGSLTLSKDILLPLLTKSANYWAQLLTPEYYTDKDGNIRYEAGKTALRDGETYCILPSYSPENNPSNYPSPSAANTAIDIAACRSNLQMLLDIQSKAAPEADTAVWEDLLEKLPPYLYDETGALKEWACKQFEENNEHRHLSHLYGVWPLDETQENPALRNACVQAIDNRTSENEASHALVHRALIAARLKDSASVTRALKTLMNHKIHYDSMMTNHDYDRSSCYCTDFAIGYLGIIHESLLYSNTGKIEILPALPDSGFESGEIKGLRTRSRAVVQSLSWDTASGTASVNVLSEIDQDIVISCAVTGEAQTVHFAAGEEKAVEFALK